MVHVTKFYLKSHNQLEIFHSEFCKGGVPAYLTLKEILLIIYKEFMLQYKTKYISSYNNNNNNNCNNNCIFEARLPLVNYIVLKCVCIHYTIT